MLRQVFPFSVLLAALIYLGMGTAMHGSSAEADTTDVYVTIPDSVEDLTIHFDFVPDTVLVTDVDTLVITAIDTVIVTETDTVFVTVRDTIYVTVTDTVIVPCDCTPGPDSTALFRTTVNGTEVLQRLYEVDTLDLSVIPSHYDISFAGEADQVLYYLDGALAETEDGAPFGLTVGYSSLPEIPVGDHTLRFEVWQGGVITLTDTLALTFVDGLTSAIDPQVLPLLIYGNTGGSQEIESARLYTDTPEQVHYLWVQAHQPFYHISAWTPTSGTYDAETAAEVRVNGGAWIPIDDEHVTCAEPENSEGCIAGGYATVRFAVPVTGVVAGENTIEFKFNGTKGIRSGYRVLSVGFKADAGGLNDFDPFSEGLHDPGLMTWYHAGTHQYEGVTAQLIEQGEQLWHNAALVNNTIGQAAINATCSSCHVTDGGGLKYFNYENEVIVSRSVFHGLTASEGKAIAAYIRALELRTDEGQTYDPPGTPWDPPFQPGPTSLASRETGDPRTQGQAFAEMDEEIWAAGAGLDWVTDTDTETMPYVFPKAPLRQDATPTVDRMPSGELNWHHVSADSTLNMRLIPISAQLPDWNNWLPDIHPVDGQPAAYENVVDDLSELMGAGFPYEVDREVQDLGQAFRDGGFRAVLESAGSDNRRKMIRVSGYQWKAVKVFEKVQLGGYADSADDRFCDDPVKPFCEALAWFGTTRNVFNIGPHISSKLGSDRFDVPPYSYGSLGMDRYYTHLWYQLQVTVNPGASPRAAKIAPVDWEYQRNFLRTAGQAGIRFFASEVKEMQVLSNGYGVDGDPNGSNATIKGLRRGFLPAPTSPDHFMQTRLPTRRKGRIYGNLTEALQKDLWMAGVRAWWDYNSRFPAGGFPQDLNKGRAYEPPSYVPRLDRTINRINIEDGIYRGLYESAAWLGPRAYPLINEITAWGEQMWPNTSGPTWDEIAPGN